MFALYICQILLLSSIYPRYMVLSKLRAQLFFCLLFLLFCIDFYHYQFFQLPYGIHEWSNGERLSLAYGFYDDGMNFFRPSTFNQESINGVVGHEFPIQSYLAALLGKLWGRGAIMMSYRAINILLFLGGLLSLFSLVFDRTKSFLFSLIPPVFFISSPMFVDYAGGFLPDPASASIVFMGFYSLFAFIDKPSRRSMVFTIVLLTLATLIKTSSIIYLAGTLLFFLWHHIQLRHSKSNSDWLALFLFSAFSGALLLGFYLHNDYLNTHYHATLFPTKPMPFKGWDDLSMYLSYSFKHIWMADYFTLPAYLFFIMVFSAIMPVLRSDAAYKGQAFLGILFFVLLIPVFGIMGNQLHVHDYYILCMFFPLLAFLLSTAAIILHRQLAGNAQYAMVKSSLMATLLLLYCFANFGVYKRLNIYEPRIIEGTRTLWMKDGKSILDGLKIPATEQILVLNEMPPNQGLLFFDRKGYIFYHDRWTDAGADSIITMMKGKNLKIAVSESNRVAATEKANPQFYQRFETLYRDDKATVFKLK
jgi:hypothetical protein